MKDVRYYKEGAHNYMVLVCSGKEEKSYQQKMLERQNLPHIFSCRIKYINGEAFYYYDITSKVNIQNLYRGKEWNLSMIRKVLSDYETALQELDSYLLEQDKLVLDPEYIYYDYGTANYTFLFYPDFQPESNAYEALFDFWVEHLDNLDKVTVDCIYKLYEEAETCCLGIERINEILEQYREPIAVPERESIGVAQAVSESERLQENTQDSILYENQPPSAVPYDVPQKQMHMLRPLGDNSGAVFYITFLVLLFLGEVGVGAVYLLFQCSEKEKLVLLTAAVVMGCLFIWIGRLLLRERGFRKRKEQYDRALTEFRENDYERSPQPVPEKVQMKEFLSVGSVRDEKDSHGIQSAYGSAYSGQNVSGNEPAGETVFFSSEAAYENKLYALDKKNKQHISLEILPITVGKLKGAVDICLNDSSVSRMHACIETDGKAYYIKDLNSTNGTFLNGLRLNPNACMEMEPGDEIKFGKLRYSFR